MTDFEKYQASAEARRTTHGDHLDQLTGYFMAETNRTRAQNTAAQMEAAQAGAETPVQEPEPPPATPRRRFGWLRWWRQS